MVRIYVGNLPWSVGDRDLQDMFEQYGAVQEASVVTDKYSGRSRGFGFIEMADEEQASVAIEALDGSDIGGRTIKVNKARPRNNGNSGHNSSYRRNSRRNYR
ncbi:MAG: RNA-binding protein [Candidatus Dadabacteria bacterium]|nr:MAG: RNA-binding protein [Candidatus Dadabacteria bacterium]